MTQNQYPGASIHEQQAMHSQELNDMRELTEEELAGVTGAFGPFGYGYGYGYGLGLGLGLGLGSFIPGYGYGYGYGLGGFVPWYPYGFHRILW